MAKKLPKGGIKKHGRNAYVRYGCRCDVCKIDNTQRCTEYRNKQKAISRANVDKDGYAFSTNVTRHGYAAYCNYGCRCEVCRAARAQVDKARNAKKKLDSVTPIR